MQAQDPSKSHQRNSSGRQRRRTAATAEPEVGQITADDLSASRGNEEQKRPGDGHCAPSTPASRGWRSGWDEPAGVPGNANGGAPVTTGSTSSTLTVPILGSMVPALGALP